MSDHEKPQTKSLRMEAQAVEMSRLSWSQLKAAAEVVEKIHSAYHQKQPKRAQDQRRNQILMVSGDKGSGKTTLALSIRRWHDLKDMKSEYGLNRLRELGHREQKDYEQTGRNISKNIEDCPRITWLDVLSLDTMPPGSNLVAAIFARITEAAARQIDPNSPFRQDRGLLEPVSLFERALHELGSLRSDAVMALEGNLHRRAEGMDPESYAIAAIENEKKKLEISDRLNNVLRRLVERTTTRGDDEVKGLFILPIDDIDSSPARAAEMLRLAYSLSIPRLVFLLLGSIDTIDQILFYQIQGEFRTLLRAEGEADTDALERVTAKANEIASSSLRKMIPPSQRITLEPLTLEHAARFKPEASLGTSQRDPSDSNSWSLEACLQAISFKPKAFYDNSSEITLRDLIFAKDHLHARSKKRFNKQSSSAEEATEEVGLPLDPSEYFYDGFHLLQSAPRQLIDLYGLLIEQTKEKGPRSLSDLIHRLFTETFRTLVDEDGSLTPPAQNALKECLRTDSFSEEAELTPSYLSMFTETGDRLEFEIPLLDHQLYPSNQVLGQRVRSLGLEVTLPGDKRRPLATSTRSSFKVIHDLIRLTGRGVITQAIPHRDRDQIAQTNWDDGVNAPFGVPWLMCDWLTFWHTEFFFRLWNRGLQRTRQICSEPAELHAKELSHLMIVIAAAAIIDTAKSQILGDGEWGNSTSGLSELLSHSSLSSLTKRKSAPPKWTVGLLNMDKALKNIADAAQDLAKTANTKKKNGEYDEQTEQIDRALVNLVLLLAPECAISDLSRSLSEHFESFLANGYIKDKLSPRVRKLRLERLGIHASTFLGITLLSPAEALRIKNLDDSNHSIAEKIETTHPLFASNSEYCPSHQDLRHAVLHTERTGAAGGILHSSELARLKSLFFNNDSEERGA